MKILAYLGALAVLLAVAFAAGWHAKGTSMAAADQRATHAELAATKVDFAQQIAQHTAALDRQQADTSALLAKQHIIRAGSADIRLEIEHAQFTPPAPAGLAPACADPAGSVEFERLYNAAAKGRGAQDPAAARAGGVP